MIDFKGILNTQRGIDGYLLEQSAAVWCVLLDWQHGTWTWQDLSKGDYLEIGVFKGKSASILAGFSTAYSNRLFLVDPAVDLRTKDTLNSLCNAVTFVEHRSEKLRHSEFLAKHVRSIAFGHIDGLHSFSAVTNDLELFEDLLDDFGILSVDDFHTDLYPQVPAAVYRHLYSGQSDLSIFLVGFNKAYLCRNAAKRYYASMVRDNLLDSLRLLDHSLTLVKTDRHDLFDSFSIGPFMGEPYHGDRYR